MISLTSLETLKSQIDIVDIISNSLTLKKSGSNFKSNCPFHSEQSASFVVSPSKQIYHCFGCSCGGDAIKFIQDYKKLSFAEAIENIANSMNFTLEYDNKKDFKDYKNIFESMNSFYKNSLQDDELQYLLDRGITKKSIKTFEIGYASSSTEQINYLKQNFLNISDACDIGILANDKDKLYARQIKRITFPIRNHTNKLIGFGGRTTINHSAKYINSHQTKLFDKSRNFYGLNIAKEYIYKKGTMVITEGYLDVVLMHQVGIQTAVATMGTALTKEHCLIIKKMNCKVLLCFDGDKAGRNAALKSSILLSQAEINGAVVIFKDNLDPADMIKDNREQELISIMKKPTPLVKYVLNSIVNKYDMSDPYAKNSSLKEAIEYLKSLNNLLIANEYISYLAKLLNIKSIRINLGQTQIIQKPQIQYKNSCADDKFFKTLIEKPEYLDFNLISKICELMESNPIYKAIIDDDIDNEILIPLKIRDDIIIYNEVDFIAACNLKYKSFLEEQLKELTQSTDDDVFVKMSRIQMKLGSIIAINKNIHV